MKPALSNPIPKDAPVVGLPADAHVAHPSGDAATLRDTLVATGLDLGHATAQVVVVHGREAATPLWDDFLAGHPRGDDAVVFLDAIAETDPATANAWLSEGLESGKITEWQTTRVFKQMGVHLPKRAWVTSLPDHLTVTHLDLGDCTSLKTLPVGLKVLDDCILIGCSSLERLPDDLKVAHRLNLRFCTAWDGVIPRSAHVGGQITTDNHPSGIHLQDWQRRYDSAPLSLDDQETIATLVQTLAAVGTPAPDMVRQVVGIHGHGAIPALWGAILAACPPEANHLDALDAIASIAPQAANGLLSEALSRGDVNLDDGYGMMIFSHREWVESLPENLTAEGDLVLSGCRNLKAIPAGFSARYSLSLDFCYALSELPDGMKVGGTLCLDGCALRSLPQGLRVGEDLQMCTCTSLTHLPDDLEVGGTLDLTGCVALKAIPPTLKVGGGMAIRSCGHITSIPPLKLGPHLDAGGCGALVHLEEGLVVNIGLDLKGCGNWDGVVPDSIPDDCTIHTDAHPDGIPVLHYRASLNRGNTKS